MSPEDQRIAIALSMGYTGCADQKCDYRKAQHLHAPGGWVCFPEPYSTVRYPDYLNDLNAMHEVEKTLSPHQRRNYPQELALICGIGQDEEWTADEDWTIIHATAAQRAEAYLRTIGKWQDEKDKG